MTRHPQTGRHRQATDRDREWARRYEAGETLQQIARGSGFSHVTVFNVIRKFHSRPRQRYSSASLKYDTNDRYRLDRVAAETGSTALARALWAYGARHSGLPNMPRELCAELVAS